MQRLSRFIPSRTKQAAHLQSPSPLAADAGLPTRSGLVAGHICETSDFVECATACNRDQECIKKCGQGCRQT